MKRTGLLAAASALALVAQNGAAQNTAEPPVVAPPPPAKAEPPAPAPPPDVVVVPRPAPAPPPPPAPVTIDPDAAYPDGFADPADPFGNDLSLAYRERDGFDWGLLGLLGLLGLIPLFRRGERYVRTVYVDRDEPRRVIREERTEG